MCEPSSIAMAAVALVGAGVSAYSSIEQGKFQEKVAKQNAELAAFDEQDAKRRGAIEEERHRDKVRALLGTQRAIMGANNVVSSTGTPLGLLAETAQLGEEDALTIRNNAARESFGFGMERSNSLLRSRMYRKSAGLDATATVLGGAAQSYGMWKKAA